MRMRSFYRSFQEEDGKEVPLAYDVLSIAGEAADVDEVRKLPTLPWLVFLTLVG